MVPLSTIADPEFRFAAPENSSTMSSPTAAAQGVSIKVNHLGVTRRFKLSLRDININTFEDKVRAVNHSTTGLSDASLPPLHTPDC